MGGPTTKPTEAAPAYEDLFHSHPTTNQQSSSAYTTVPQVDTDIDHHHHHHAVDEESHPSSNNIDLTKPHVHCEVCDRQLERREKRNAEKHCCMMVGATFIVAIVCAMLLGIVIAKANSRK